jgi:hypothetical protein
MVATRLKGKITSSRKLIVEIPHDLTPGSVEVILLQDAPAKVAKKPLHRIASHPAFGLWTDRADVIDSADYAAQLRQQLEQRSDRHD